jgi:hypothetical protein
MILIMPQPQETVNCLFYNCKVIVMVADRPGQIQLRRDNLESFPDVLSILQPQGQPSLGIATNGRKLICPQAKAM